MLISIENKVCSCCKESKTVDQFRKAANNKKDGLYNFCIQCQDTYNRDLYQRKKDKRKKQAELWNLEHHEETKIYKINSYYKKIGKKPPKRKKINPIPDAPYIPPELNF